MVAFLPAQPYADLIVKVDRPAYVWESFFHEDNGYKGMHPNNLGWAV